LPCGNATEVVWRGAARTPFCIWAMRLEGCSPTPSVLLSSLEKCAVGLYGLRIVVRVLLAHHM